MPTLIPVATIAALCAASAIVWLRRWRHAAAPSIGTVPHVPAGAIVFGLFWIIYHLANDVTALLADVPPPAFDPARTLTALQQNCFLFATGVLVLWTLLAHGDSLRFREFGAGTDRVGRHVLDGVATATSTWLPVFATLWLTLPLRTPDRQHAVLQLLGAQPSFAIYAWAVLSAVVVAPLFEELVFRVILQTWLEQYIGKLAVLVAAVLFAAVHRFPDSLAIVPLALILGDAYLGRRSYWEIVTAHGVFNAIMLGLDAVSSRG